MQSSNRMPFWAGLVENMSHPRRDGQLLGLSSFAFLFRGPF